MKHRRGPALEWCNPTPRDLCLLVMAGFLAVQAVALLAMGHPLICTCGYIALWHGNPAGPETSQHITDWYTFTHVIHGIVFYAIISLIAPRMPMSLRFVLAFALETTWEIVENTPLLMERYRQSALARGYFGDSIVNSVSDTLAAAIGFLAARKLPVYASVALVALIELFLGYMIRDNLALNIVQLMYPNDTVSNWQMGR